MRKRIDSRLHIGIDFMLEQPPTVDGTPCKLWLLREIRNGSISDCLKNSGAFTATPSMANVNAIRTIPGDIVRKRSTALHFDVIGMDREFP